MGPGAIEPYVRYSQLDLGNIIFKDNLADGHLWTNNVYMIDLGLNWYPNRWVKFYIDWQHAAFGSPVLVNEVLVAVADGDKCLRGGCVGVHGREVGRDAREVAERPTVLGSLRPGMPGGRCRASRLGDG